MTAEEVFDDLSHKYGEDFNWHMLPFTNKTFVAELKSEIALLQIEDLCEGCISLCEAQLKY